MLGDLFTTTKAGTTVITGANKASTTGSTQEVSAGLTNMGNSITSTLEAVAKSSTRAWATLPSALASTRTISAYRPADLACWRQVLSQHALGPTSSMMARIRPPPP
jgi:hypothetical protein